MNYRICLMFLLLAVAAMACDVQFVTPTVEAVETPTKQKLSTPTAVIEEIPTEVLTDLNESQQSPINSSVTVTHATVNLRNATHASTGDLVFMGDSLAVDCGPDGYCLILDGEHAGLYIWRGCTSDPSDYGCEAK